MKLVLSICGGYVYHTRGHCGCCRI